MLLANGPYGMTAHAPSVSYVANGWDRNQLGWRAPGKTHLISALVDAVNGQIERHLRQASDRDDTFSWAGGRTKLALSTHPAPLPL